MNVNVQQYEVARVVIEEHRRHADRARLRHEARAARQATVPRHRHLRAFTADTARQVHLRTAAPIAAVSAGAIFTVLLEAAGK